MARTLVTNQRNYTFIDGVSVGMVIFSIGALNLVLTLLESWVSLTVGYGMIAGLCVMVLLFFKWKLDLDDDYFTDTVDYYSQDAIVFAMVLFIVSEIFIFFGMFWVVIYGLLVDLTVDSAVSTVALLEAG